MKENSNETHVTDYDHMLSNKHVKEHKTYEQESGIVSKK